MESNLAKQEPRSLVAKAEPPSNPMDLMRICLSGDVTMQKAEVFGKLLQYQREELAIQAKREYTAAFCQLQNAVKHVRGDRWVDLGGGKGYFYSSYREIMEELQPHLAAFGFSVQFAQKLESNGITTVVGTLMHVAGHSVEVPFQVRSGKGAPGMNETKCDISAATIAQRECLCRMFNLVRLKDEEDDAKIVGSPAPVTQDQEEHVRQRVQETGSDLKAFLKVFSITKLSDLPADRYHYALELLDKKERQNERDGRVPV